MRMLLAVCPPPHSIVIRGWLIALPDVVTVKDVSVHDTAFAAALPPQMPSPHGVPSPQENASVPWFSQNGLATWKLSCTRCRLPGRSDAFCGASMLFSRASHQRSPPPPIGCLYSRLVPQLVIARSSSRTAVIAGRLLAYSQKIICTLPISPGARSRPNSSNPPSAPGSRVVRGTTLAKLSRMLIWLSGANVYSSSPLPNRSSVSIGCRPLSSVPQNLLHLVAEPPGRRPSLRLRIRPDDDVPVDRNPAPLPHHAVPAPPPFMRAPPPPRPRPGVPRPPAPTGLIILPGRVQRLMEVRRPPQIARLEIPLLPRQFGKKSVVELLARLIPVRRWALSQHLAAESGKKSVLQCRPLGLRVPRWPWTRPWGPLLPEWR